MANRVAAEKAFQSVENVLGGKDVLGVKPQSSVDWVWHDPRGHSGGGSSQPKLAQALGIPQRTLARRKREGILNSEESSKLLRLARVVSRASEVFDDPAAAVDWLKSPNAALRGNAPLSLLDTDIGAESVLDMLGRIEHGVFA